MSLLMVFTSCENDPQPIIEPGEEGFFIVNEGAFGNGNASLSFYDRSKDEVVNNVFAAVNGRPLGDQAQSMTVHEGKGYIVVQNSGKIEVINTGTYVSITTITDGLASPRYVLIVSSTKAYVSDWGLDGVTGTVKVLNLSTNTITKSIPVGKGANGMILMNDKVYVANSGGWGKDNTISVINISTDTVVDTIEVGDNPNSIVAEQDGTLWVSSSGALAYNDDWTIDEANSSKGSISKIVSDEEVLRLPVSKFTINGPANLTLSADRNTLYFRFDAKVFSMPVTGTSLPSEPFKEKAYYGLSVDPISGHILGFSAPNFSVGGYMEMLDESGELVDSYLVGIAPNGCAFK